VRSFFGGINFLIAQFVEQCNPTFTWGDGPVWNESILPGLAPRRASSTFYQGAQLKEEQLSFLYVSVPQIDRLTMRRPVSVNRFLAFFLSSSFFLLFSRLFPLSQAASVATLPSALFVERLSLGARWVYLIQ
jgi:hypothetical protein